MRHTEAALRRLTSTPERTNDAEQLVLVAAHAAAIWTVLFGS
ncbi:hypothetical protein ACJ7VE_16770 [Streptomyces sp. PB17]|nr:hypothetical protein [Streptomyces sp. CS113]